MNKIYCGVNTKFTIILENIYFEFYYNNKKDVGFVKFKTNNLLFNICDKNPFMFSKPKKYTSIEIEKTNINNKLFEQNPDKIVDIIHYFQNTDYTKLIFHYIENELIGVTYDDNI